MTGSVIYHICRHDEWRAVLPLGPYPGSSQDAADGFIHFSTASQVVESAVRHRAGQDRLVLVAVDFGRLGSDLKWEASRRGALFPHLYGPLPLSAVRWVKDLPLGRDGMHVFPTLEE